MTKGPMALLIWLLISAVALADGQTSEKRVKPAAQAATSKPAPREMTQDNRLKGEPGPIETQRFAAMSSTQSEPGQQPEDQRVVYRLRLLASDFPSELVLANASDQEGDLFVATVEPGSPAGNEVRATLAPGESLRMNDQRIRWTSSGQVYVKASRRLRLSLIQPGSSEPLQVALDPASAQYEIFSMERQAEVELAGQNRRVEMLAPGSNASRAVSAEAASSQAVGELWNAAQASGRRALFLTHSSK